MREDVRPIRVNFINFIHRLPLKCTIGYAMRRKSSEALFSALAINTIYGGWSIDLQRHVMNTT